MILLEMVSNDLALLKPLWQTGVGVAVDVGASIRHVCRQIGIPDDYLDERIQTLFLNGKAVDDPDKTIVSEGAVLALSAAMPGLAGATLRKGGSYASLRNAITQKAVSPHSTARKQGVITVKLFNFISQELAPILIRHGIYVKSDELLHLLRKPECPFPTLRIPSIQVHEPVHTPSVSASATGRDSHHDNGAMPSDARSVVNDRADGVVTYSRCIDTLKDLEIALHGHHRILLRLAD